MPGEHHSWCMSNAHNLIQGNNAPLINAFLAVVRETEVIEPPHKVFPLKPLVLCTQISVVIKPLWITDGLFSGERLERFTQGPTASDKSIKKWRKVPELQGVAMALGVSEA